ncbi:MAG: flagellar brake protein [Spirochaetota bacterium]
MKIIISLFVLFIIIVAIIIRYRGEKGGFPWFEFYSRGRKEGFSFKEIGFLRRIAVQNRLSRPQSIFWSTRQMDRCLRPAIQNINADEETALEQKQALINKLLRLRKKAEFNLPKYHKRIRETTALLPRQKLVIKDSTYGTFLSWVVEVHRKYLVVSYPTGHKGSQSLNWKGRKIGIYFWRQDDAGYFFDTRVLEQITQEEYPLLYLAHSTNLKRAQKRKSVRVETNLYTKFYPVISSNIQGVNKLFISKKSRSGKIIDLSETGCCMIAGKMLNNNDRVKLDFFLTDEKRIVALGVIVNISRTKDERVKKYHIMFAKIGTSSRNNILLYVYNIFGERTEEEKSPRAASVRSK